MLINLEHNLIKQSYLYQQNYFLHHLYACRFLMIVRFHKGQAVQKAQNYCLCIQTLCSFTRNYKHLYIKHFCRIFI
jgi:hypothetical protein